jgi:acyl-CoA thioester hydrolase
VQATARHALYKARAESAIFDDRPPFPVAARRMAAHVCISEFRVRYAETDQMGVVYHANYLVWCEVGRTDLIRELGMPYARLEERGVLLAVADAGIRFHASARYDDRIRVETTVADVRSRSVTFEYRIFNADTDARLVTAHTKLLALDRDARPARLPDELRAVLEASAAGTAGTAGTAGAASSAGASR